MRQWIALKLFKKLRQIRRDEHVLNTLFWECTLRCNLKCRHCGSDCTVDPALKDMPAKDFFRVLDNEITPNVNPNKVLVILSGGEVLVRKDLEEIGLNLYRRGYPWGMVTNGLGLTRQRFDSLVRAGLHSITVSLDGFEEEHFHIRQNKDSFARAVEAVRMISADKELASDVVTCVTPALLPKLDKFKEFLYSSACVAGDYLPSFRWVVRLRMSRYNSTTRSSPTSCSLSRLRAKRVVLWHRTAVRVFSAATRCA